VQNNAKSRRHRPTADFTDEDASDASANETASFRQNKQQQKSKPLPQPSTRPQQRLQIPDSKQRKRPQNPATSPRPNNPHYNRVFANSDANMHQSSPILSTASESESGTATVGHEDADGNDLSLNQGPTSSNASERTRSQRRLSTRQHRKPNGWQRN